MSCPWYIWRIGKKKGGVKGGGERKRGGDLNGRGPYDDFDD